MAFTRRPPQAGFTLIELMIVVAIIGILASLALGQVRDYSRRAKLSEVILAATHCKNSISEGYLSMTASPPPGAWGCESAVPTTTYVGAVQTSANGAVRLAIANLDPALNGQHLHLVPARLDGTPMSADTDLGGRIYQWLCGSDVQEVRNALPSNCRTDTAPFAAVTFK